MSLRLAIQEFQKQVSLEAEYDRFNRAYFGGELPPVKLSWERSKTRGGVALGIINRITKEIRPTEIRISMFMKMEVIRLPREAASPYRAQSFRVPCLTSEGSSTGSMICPTYASERMNTVTRYRSAISKAR